MKIIITENVLLELNIKRKEANDDGTFVDVYPIKDTHVGKVVRDNESHHKETILSYYRIMQKYPELFGNIKITPKGTIIQDKFNVEAGKKLLNTIETTYNVYDLYRIDGFRYDFIDTVYDIVDKGVPINYDQIKQMGDNSTRLQPLLKFFHFLEKIRDVYLEIFPTGKGKFSDIHRSNLALDSNGDWKCIDFINPAS